MDTFLFIYLTGRLQWKNKIKVTSEINSRGFKRFFGRGAGLTFEARLALIEQGTGGRVIHRMPADANDDWYDEHGVAQPRPQPPANLAHLKPYSWKFS